MAKSVDGNSKGRPKVVYLKDECLYLVCEWGDCRKAFTEMEPFANHVRGHLREHPESDMRCIWRECAFVSYTIEERTRHVMFHPYHVRLKSMGASFLSRASSAQCTLNKQGRNLIPELPDQFHCLWLDCLIQLNDTCEFYDHVNQHVEMYPKGNVPGGITCIWDGCNGNFESQRRLRDHLRSHTQEKLAACCVCGGLFANRTKFVDHVRRQKVVSKYDVFQCSHCSKDFPSERLLRDHMRMHVNHYKCPYCNMTTPTPSSLNAHIKYRHSNEKPFCCADCDYKAKSLTDLRRHFIIHSSEAAYKCSYSNCSYATRSRSSFLSHTRKLHEGLEYANYKCHICESCFGRGSYLTKHLIDKHNYRRPSGHSRFRYKSDDDGFCRLQTVRYESIELSQEMTSYEDEEDNDSENAPESETMDTEDVAEASASGSVIQLPLNMLHDRKGTLVISFQQEEDGTVVVQTVAPEESSGNEEQQQGSNQTENSHLLDDSS